MRARASSLKKTKELSRTWGPLKPRDVSCGRDKASTALTVAFSVAAHPAAPLALPHTRSRLLGQKGGVERELGPAQGGPSRRSTPPGHADEAESVIARGADVDGGGAVRDGGEKERVDDEGTAPGESVAAQKEGGGAGKGEQVARSEKIEDSGAVNPPPGASTAAAADSVTVAALQEGCKREFATPKMAPQPQTPGTMLTGNARGKGRVLRDDSPSLLPPPTFDVTRILEQVATLDHGLGVSGLERDEGRDVRRE